MPSTDFNTWGQNEKTEDAVIEQNGLFTGIKRSREVTSQRKGCYTLFNSHLPQLLLPPRRRGANTLGFKIRITGTPPETIGL